MMNINGDLVEFRSADKKEGERMIHINGEEIQNEQSDLVLAQGGVINYKKGRHIVKWPTGEQMIISQRKFKQNTLFDLQVNVPSYRDEIGRASCRERV